MTIADMGKWDVLKLILKLLFKTEKTTLPADELLAILNESGVKNIKVTGRGTVEVSVDELKNSPQFKELAKYAKIRVEQDLKRLKEEKELVD